MHTRYLIAAATLTLLSGCMTPQSAPTSQVVPAASGQTPGGPRTTTGGGDLLPELSTDAEAIRKFQDRKIGLSIHWGPSSLGGKEISWSRNKEIPKATYDNFYKSFNPVKFDAGEWMDLARAGGMKYIILTSKHHDGFALWPSKYTPYNISATPFKRDIVRELADASRARDITFGTYYSILDWYHPDYQPYNNGGPGPLIPTDARTPDFDRYLEFMRGQLRELVVDYGAEIVQYDGEWDPTWTHERGTDLYRYTRSLGDGILVSNRVDVGRKDLDPATKMWNWRVYAGDFDERERMVDWIKDQESRVFGKSDNPWQAWVTIDQAQWSWNETPRLLSANEIILDLVKTIGDGGNYLINLGPKPDGTFDKTQADAIRTVGAWIGRHAQAVYGSRAGPFAQEGRYTSTRVGSDVYLFVVDPALANVTLDLASMPGAAITDMSGATVAASGPATARRLALPTQSDAGVRMIRLRAP